MNQRKGAHRNAKKGVAAVEFALILPIFLTLLFSTMDYGWMFFQQLAITSAAREGARVGALAASGTSNSTIASSCRTAVNDYLAANGIPTSDATTTTTVTTGSGSTPGTVTVAVSLRFRPLIGVIFLPDNAQPYPTNLTASAIMRREF